MTGRIALACVGLAGPVLAEGEAPSQSLQPCRAEASAQPSRAIVGEQVLYHVRIYSRDDVDRVEWAYPPSFPNVRTETLPGDPQPKRQDAADGYRVRDERRALFAERAGSYALRAPELRCSFRGQGVAVVRVPVALLEVKDPPAAGRPEDFAGQVGPLTLHLTVTPLQLSLGESVRVAVMVRGSGNLWSLRSPFPEGAFGGAEVFERRSELVLERGNSLFLRRHFIYDVVPRDAGVLRVPAIAQSYFDPATGAYGLARAEPVDVAVAPRAEAPQGAATFPARGRGGSAGEPSSSRKTLYGLGALALLVAVVAGGVWLRHLRVADPTGEALAEAGELAASGDRDQAAAALSRALRAALVPHVKDARAVAPEELLARRQLGSAVASAAQLLASLERARFDPEAPPPDAQAVRRAISELD